MKEHACVLIALVVNVGLSSGQLTKSCPYDNFNNVNVAPDDIKRPSSFGLDLFREVKKQVPGKNIFFSPYSIWSLLVIAYFGAEGNTLAQLQESLKLGRKDEGYKTQRLISDKLGNHAGVQLDEVNRAYFVDNLVLEECFNRGEFYDVQQFDSSNPERLAQEINQLVNSTTKGLIPKLVETNDLTRAISVLINAVYFKGFWETKFDERSTRSEDFFCNPGAPCGKVEMMWSESYNNYIIDDHLSAEVIELPYKDSSISMLLFLPLADNTVDGVVDRLDLPALRTTISNLREQNIYVGVPKFRMEQTLKREIIPALGGLGITDLFSNNADLSAFTKTAPLNVDTIIHKAVVDVNEEGTEAAAATGGIAVLSLPPSITFNRPFVFMIVDKSLDLTLFSGIFRTPPSDGQQ